MAVLRAVLNALHAVLSTIPREPDQCRAGGDGQGHASLAVHRRLDALVESASYVDTRHAQIVPVSDGDAGRPPPPRACWLRSVRQVEYRDRLGAVRAPTLLRVGRRDPQTPVPCTLEIAAGIAGSEVVVLEGSGHSPFVEEPETFLAEVTRFLGAAG